MDRSLHRRAASDFPAWGFKIAPTAQTPDDERYFLLPREALAFAEGIKVAAERARKAIVARDLVETMRPPPRA
jgi:hypothetical protein